MFEKKKSLNSPYITKPTQKMGGFLQPLEQLTSL